MPQNVSDRDYVFGLDIGTRNVVGVVGYKDENDIFRVEAFSNVEHSSRSMIDGQIHDIGRVAKTVALVKQQLEEQLSFELKDVCIAAAGRVLRTVTTRVGIDFPEEAVVTGEDIHTLDLLGIDKAQQELREKNDTKYRFYCVGYSVVKYYLNEEVFVNLEGHKADKIEEDIIVTFLPEDVVDGLYSACEQAGLTVANMTLEPIAAINVAIPENFRMLNIALIDVGAGTSDICITKDGSIIAYGMIPCAGDELTEILVQNYLCDFAMAEKIKLTSTTEKEVEFTDIMALTHIVPASEVWEVLRDQVDNMTTMTAEKIKELNGNKSVSACFIVGGGGKVHGYSDQMSAKLGIIKERVALRGEEVLGMVEFGSSLIKKDPLLVTPIGICLNYYDQKNNFIMVRFNGELEKLYDNGKLTVVDAALAAGYDTDDLFPKRGKEINYTVNGKARIARGEAGESAVITINGRTANIHSELEQGCMIEISPSTGGDEARLSLDSLEEYGNSYMTFEINGQSIKCPKFVEVNGTLEPGTYEIQDGDVIEFRNYYTVSQLATFMDAELTEDSDVFVNGRQASMNSLVYENFSVQWKAETFASMDNSYKEIPPINVICNGQSVTLTGKIDYMFVDIFDAIGFDVNAGGGRDIELLLNGETAAFAQPLTEGDELVVRWKE